eukprot:16093814-Heterocapsa_arctica.AAC.1
MVVMVVVVVIVVDTCSDLWAVHAEPVTRKYTSVCADTKTKCSPHRQGCRQFRSPTADSRCGLASQSPPGHHSESLHII